MIVLEVLGMACVALGALLLLVGAVGVVRLPDFYSRLHAAGKGDSLGQTLVLGGLMMLGGTWNDLLKLFFIVLLVLLLSPTACHALARSARLYGLVPWRRPEDVPPSGSDPWRT